MALVKIDNKWINPERVEAVANSTAYGSVDNPVTVISLFSGKYIRVRGTPDQVVWDLAFAGRTTSSDTHTGRTQP